VALQHRRTRAKSKAPFWGGILMRTCLKVYWKHESPDEPTVLYSELDDRRMDSRRRRYPPANSKHSGGLA
jgi:hypothetical protein